MNCNTVWNIQEHFILDVWKFQNSLIILWTCVEAIVVLHKIKNNNVFWKYDEFLESCVLSISHEYVVGLNFLFINVCYNWIK
jgi:hypothetical protein